MHLVIRSPLGKAFLAIRDNDVRASLIGLNVYLLRLMAFVMAGFLAGVAGALFAFFGRYASATYMFYHVSGEAVVWAIVGGAGTLFGPIIGTSLFIIIREIVSTHWEHHSLIVGMMAILVVILAPKGIGRSLADGLDRLDDARRDKRTPRQNCGPIHERASPPHRKSDQAVRRPDGRRQSQPQSCRAAGCRRSSVRTAPARPPSSIWYRACSAPTAAVFSFWGATLPASSRTRSAGSASSARCRSRASSISSAWPRISG